MQVSNKAQPIKTSPPKPFQGIRLGVPESSEQSPILVLNPDCPLDTFEIQGQHQSIINEPKDEDAASIQADIEELRILDPPLAPFFEALVDSLERTWERIVQDHPEAAEIFTNLNPDNFFQDAPE